MDMPTPLVTTDWLQTHLEDPGLRIFDCTVEFSQGPQGVRISSGRPGWEAGHIPGAGFLDLLSELSDLDDPRPSMMPPPAQFAEVMGRAGVGPGAQVVLYDRAGAMWAARIWWMLRAFGFDAAAVLDGGLRKWTAEGRPLTADPPAWPAARFEARPRPGLIADKAEVRAAIGDPGVVLVNALPAKVHSGEVAPYGRPGRIAGSVNVPADSLLDPESGAYAERSALRAAFERVGALGPGRVIAYCGGGVSACSDALALTLLGASDVAVYDGSLAEWCADPDAPMETGPLPIG